MLTNLAKLDLKDKTVTAEAGSPELCMNALPGESAEQSYAYDGVRVVLMPITDVAGVSACYPALIPIPQTCGNMNDCLMLLVLPIPFP